jgi:hypothetical protein
MIHHLVKFLVCAAIGCSCSCTGAAETPATPGAVVALADAYDQPTAVLTADSARAVVDRTQALREVLQALRGLQFLRDIVEDATSLSDADIESLAVRGALDARTACPGWSDATLPDQATDGSIEVTIGVDASRVQRAFGGRATECRFVTLIAGQRANAVATMVLEVDLGGSLGLGEPTPAILVRATNLSGSVGNVALNLGPEVLSFRLLEDGAIDSLVDTVTLVPGSIGSVLLELSSDGTVTVRGRDGDWACGQGGAACTRVAAPS